MGAALCMTEVWTPSQLTLGSLGFLLFSHVFTGFLMLMQLWYKFSLLAIRPWWQKCGRTRIQQAGEQQEEASNMLLTNVQRTSAGSHMYCM